MMTTHVVPAAAETLVPAGLDGGADTGGVLGVTGQPGTLFSRMHVRISDLSPVAFFNGQSISAKPHLRRVGRMIDFYPEADNGLHFSAGMHVLVRRGKNTFSPDRDASVTALIYAPAMISRLTPRNNINRVAPAATAGWTTHLTKMAMVGLEAGVLMQHGGADRTAFAIAQPMIRAAAWSRINPVAQASFALKF
ncbi:hypothetical protein [Sphingomonas sp. MMS24-J13]|uniref:hypothetical protein n=1 Tax=Sphingomonas sp. MMS24-J13 TaxID=3238686 RepID=UPI0038506FB5